MVLPFLPVVFHAEKPGSQQEKYYRAFMRWLLGGRKREDIAKELRITRNTLHLRFDVFLRDIPAAPTPKFASDCLLLDAFWFRGRHRNLGVLLIAHDVGGVVSFAFADCEDYRAWKDFLAALPQPREEAHYILHF